MTTLNTYLTFNGNCELAFEFYRSVLGGEYAHVGKFRDMPDDQNYQIAESEHDKIMHISLPIGETSVLMGCDTGGEWASSYSQGNNFSVSITADTKHEADRLFAGLSKNGQVIMPMDSTFWESYFGMFTDQFGIQWMVSFDETTQNNK